MIPMFIEEGLEMEPDSEEPEGLLTCLEVKDTETGQRLGGASLVYDKDVFILKTVAVKKEFQGRGLGSQIADCGLLFLKLHKQHLHQFFFGTGGTGLGKQQMEIVGLSVRQQGEPFGSPLWALLFSPEAALAVISDAVESALVEVSRERSPSDRAS